MLILERHRRVGLLRVSVDPLTIRQRAHTAAKRARKVATLAANLLTVLVAKLRLFLRLVQLRFPTTLIV